MADEKSMSTDIDRPKEVPVDVWASALRNADEYIYDDEPNAFEFAISLAILEERKRCAEIARTYSHTAQDARTGISAAILTPSKTEK